ncbi:MAG: metal ABC transporter ATP-binding protein [Fibrobacter sp.]|nr:metal ABC transporter ATP-binding protein [Fibrobacter sp.]
MTSAIDIKNLSFAYNKSPVLTNVNLSIDENDFVAIIGPNGGGKSTLMRLMVGLLKPKDGEVRLFGEKVPTKKVAVGYVPQNTNKNIEFPITVGECVATGKLGLKPKSSEVAAALAKVHMDGYLDRRMGELSGGERQRVLIARSLVCNPKILFLDEPSNNIDVAGIESLYNMLAEFSETMTIVIVTHDLMALSHKVKSVVCVNKNVHYHEGGNLTEEMLHSTYGCEVDLIAHGVPHRVLGSHDHTHGGCCEHHHEHLHGNTH